MIVDLITHDLHRVVGENVMVKKFCGVEEYETVWQLVSVIEGAPPRAPHGLEVEWGLGWDLLGNSLPPGESPSTSLPDRTLFNSRMGSREYDRGSQETQCRDPPNARGF